MKTRRRNAFTGWFVSALLSAFAGHADAQGMRVHMHGTDEGYAADGVLYAPAEAKDTPALLLIPDERGVTQRIGDAALRFLDAGYLVVVVDLDRGLPPDPATRTDQQVDHDVAAALGFVASRANVGRDAVGLIGWGSGGAAALRLGYAAQSRAIAIENAAPLPSYAGLHATRADILVSFAGQSTDPSLPSSKALAARLRTLAKTVTLHVYPNAESAEPRAHELQFFKEHLAPRPPP